MDGVPVLLAEHASLGPRRRLTHRKQVTKIRATIAAAVRFLSGLL